MIMKKIIYIIISLIPVLWIGCKEDPIGQTPTNTTPPPPVTNVVIIPLNGGARISYTIPDTEDVAYVKGEYEHKGVKYTVRSSVYKDFMIIEGLGNTDPVSISLSVVNLSEVSSIPVVETFVPLEPAIKGISESIKIEADFGGINIYWDNPTLMIAGISIFMADESGQFEFQDVVFSSLEKGMSRIRGLPDVDTHFGFVVFDKYHNSTDTVSFWAKPIYEKMLNKRTFSEANLAGDNTTTWSGNRFLPLLFNGNYLDLWVSGNSPSLPGYFTIDLGILATLSRFVFFFRTDYAYNQFTPEIFKVYGTDELTHPRNDSYFSDGSWKNDWIDLTPEDENDGLFVTVKPSGQPLGTNTTEDMTLLRAGIEFKFRLVTEKIRYLRFEVIQVFGRSMAMEAQEIDIFGDDGSKETETE